MQNQSKHFQQSIPSNKALSPGNDPEPDCHLVQGKSFWSSICLSIGYHGREFQVTVQELRMEHTNACSAPVCFSHFPICLHSLPLHLGHGSGHSHYFPSNITDSRSKFLITVKLKSKTVNSNSAF